MTESPPAIDDMDLVRQHIAGDGGALPRIMERYHGLILTLCRQQLKNETDAEEITADVFIRVNRGLKNFRGDSSLKTWLYRIAVNLCRNRYWYHHRRRRHLTMSLDCPIGDSSSEFHDIIPDESGDHRDSIELDQLESNISEAMQRISQNQRRILELLVYEHKSYEEIASILHINLGTVKSRVARARQAVRDSLTIINMPPTIPSTPSATARPASAMTTKVADIGAWLQSQNVRFVSRITVYQIEVAPRLAEAWLKLNTKNRIPSTPKIRRFANMMKEGRWILNGETIKFADNGRLLDGQSRLMAIVRAGVSVVLEVRGGIADSAQESMDTGEARQHRHQLEMLGEKYPNEIAAALRLVYFWERGHIGGSGTTKSGKSDITNTTIREMMERHPRIRESVGRCLNLKALLPISGAAFFHYVFAQVDEKRGNLFIERLTTGANLGENSPVYLLRERLTQDRLASAKIKKREKFALIVKAWNAFYGGKEIPKLVFYAAETFPEIAGGAKKETAA